MYLISNHCYFIWNFKGISIGEAAEVVGEKPKFGKEVSTEDKSIFDKFDYNPTQLAKVQHRQVYAHHTETYPDQENGGCVPYPVGFLPVLEKSNSRFTEIQPKLNIIK